MRAVRRPDFDREVIVLCVRWYLRYKLSLRDLVAMVSERGLSLAHTTIMRWVKRFTPEFVKRWNRFATAAGRSWRVDETYVKIRGKWVYIRAGRRSRSRSTGMPPRTGRAGDEGRWSATRRNESPVLVVSEQSG